jgi:hypothetical protein
LPNPLSSPDRKYLSAVMSRSSKAYPHAPFAMFYWPVNGGQSVPDIGGKSGPRASDVLLDARLDLEWYSYAEVHFARGGREIHRLAMDAFATKLRSIPRQRPDAYATAGTLAVGVFTRAYEFALLSFGKIPFSHGVIRSQDEAFKVIEDLNPMPQAALIELVMVLDAFAASQFDLVAAVNHKIQEARIEWQRGKLPTAGYHGPAKRRGMRT